MSWFFCITQVHCVYGVDPEEVVALDTLPKEILDSQIASHLTHRDLAIFRRVSKSCNKSLDLFFEKCTKENWASIKIQLGTSKLTIGEFSKQSQQTRNFLEIDLGLSDWAERLAQIQLPTKIKNIRQQVSAEILLEILPNAFTQEGSPPWNNVKNIVEQAVLVLGFHKPEKLKVTTIIQLNTDFRFYLAKFNEAVSRIQTLFNQDLDQALFGDELAIHFVSNDVDSLKKDHIKEVYSKCKNIQKLSLDLFFSHHAFMRDFPVAAEMNRLQSLRICHIQNLSNYETTDQSKATKAILANALEKLPHLEELKMDNTEFSLNECCAWHRLKDLPKMRIFELTSRIKNDTKAFAQMNDVYPKVIERSVLCLTWHLDITNLSDLAQAVEKILELTQTNLLTLKLILNPPLSPSQWERLQQQQAPGLGKMQFVIPHILKLNKDCKNLNIEIKLGFVQVFNKTWQSILIHLCKFRNCNKLEILIDHGETLPTELSILPQLATTLAFSPTKVILNFSRATISDRCYDRLSEFAACLCAMQELIFKGNLTVAAKFISQFKDKKILSSLQKIKLSSRAHVQLMPPVDAQCVAPFLQTLTDCTELRELDLILSDLDKASLSNLQDLLLKLPTLEHLTLNQRGFKYSGICKLRKAIQQALDNVHRCDPGMQVSFQILPNAEIATIVMTPSY
jgi:hypothetical protein